MAASITRSQSVPNPLLGVVDVTLDNSYPTGGYLLEPSDFGFPTSILGVVAQSRSGYASSSTIRRRS